MKCPVCGKKSVQVEYRGYIRDGKVMSVTEEEKVLYRCTNCCVIWHDREGKDFRQYYESEAYRMELEGTSAIDDFYKAHDRESLEKLTYTGTDIYRNKKVMDVGCGGGAFLDNISGAADEVIGIEPTLHYRQAIKARGYQAFAYMSDAMDVYKGRTDIITSFDVIEHVENPLEFLTEIYELLSPGGKAYIGTPTDAPVMRKIMGNEYEKKLLFSIQHLWIFHEKTLCYLAEKAGFCYVEIVYKQRYGLDNLISWMQYRRPMEVTNYPFITKAINDLWKCELERTGLSDYILLKLIK